MQTTNEQNSSFDIILFETCAALASIAYRYQMHHREAATESLWALALASASSSPKVPLLRHISLNMPPSLLIKFSGVSNSAIWDEVSSDLSTV